MDRMDGQERGRVGDKAVRPAMSAGFLQCARVTVGHLENE